MTTPSATPAQSRRPRRFRFRFSLRLLLLIVSLVGAFCGLVLRPALEQRTIVQGLEKLGATVGYDREIGFWGYPVKPKPTWLNSIVGVDFLHTATNIKCTYDAGRVLRAAAKLPHITSIDLTGCDVTDNDLVEIRGLKTLKELRLDVYAPGVESLESVRIRDSHLADAGLEHLENLSALETLSLDGRSNLTDTGMAHLAKLTSLRSLNLSQTSITDAGLANLQSLHSLKELDLAGCKVTDAGLGILEPIGEMDEINLFGTQTTQEGIEELAKHLLVRQWNLPQEWRTDTVRLPEGQIAE